MSPTLTPYSFELLISIFVRNVSAQVMEFKELNRGDICDSGFSGSEDAKIQLGVSARCRKGRLRMQNFCGRYLQGVERAD